MLDNRELAALIWLVLACFWILSRENFRAQIGDLLRDFWKPVILVPFLLLFGYIGLEVWVGARLGLWTNDLLVGTLVWAVGTGAVLFFNAAKVGDQPDFFRRAVAATVGVTVFVEFFMNVFVMSLLVEFILVQPAAAALAVLTTVAGMHDKHQPVKAFLNGLSAILGGALLTFVAWQFFQNWSQIDHARLLHELLLPIWLTIGLLPFLCFWRLYVAYDSAWRGINWATANPGARWRACAALITSFLFQYRELADFSWRWCSRLAEAPSYSAACQVIDEFRRERAEAAQAAAAERDRLQRYAGVEGTDGDGRRLDRREFEETMDALRWLHTCQMGWYERHGDRYRDDLLDMMGDSLTRHGLPEDHGITLEVADDGQSWYAWRRTATGWCFAIGAADAPPDQWEYDGPDPPDGFPGEHPAWGDAAFSDEVNQNWW